MAADDGGVLPSGKDRLDEAELAEAALERVELILGDPPRVRRVRAQAVEWDLLLNRQVGGGYTASPRIGASSARGFTGITR